MDVMKELAPLRRHMVRFHDDTFFEQRMAKRFECHSDAYLTILWADKMANDAYGNSLRKNGKVLKRFHPREMIAIADYLNINDPAIYVAICLHDLPEEFKKQGWTYDRVEQEFGRRVRWIVVAVTKHPGQKGMSEKERIRRTYAKVERGGRRAVLVKVIDRIQNHLDPYEGGEKQMMKKASQTREYLIGLAERFKVNTKYLMLSVLFVEEHCKPKKQ